MIKLDFQCSNQMLEQEFVTKYFHSSSHDLNSQPTNIQSNLQKSLKQNFPRWVFKMISNRIKVTTDQSESFILKTLLSKNNKLIKKTF